MQDEQYLELIKELYDNIRIMRIRLLNPDKFDFQFEGSIPDLKHKLFFYKIHRLLEPKYGKDWFTSSPVAR